MCKRLSILCLSVLSLSLVTKVAAWDYEGHRMVNQLATASLPPTFPAFALTPAAQERIAFLAGEPDRWRNTQDLPLKHFNGLDHYMDVDDLPTYNLTDKSVSAFRYEFTAQLAAKRALHPTTFPAIDPEKNEDKSRELIGFLPWALTENYEKLKSGFSSLKAYESDGNFEEIANAQQNIIYIMGVMGHYAGDAGQPLHTTKHHHGWVGANPSNYSTNNGIHSFIDGGYIKKSGIGLGEIKAKVRVAKLIPDLSAASKGEDVFRYVMNYVMQQHELVEPLYVLDRDGVFSKTGEDGAKGREFITGQLLKSGQLLGDLWYSAWQTAPPDSFLKSYLVRRKLDANSKK